MSAQAAAHAFKFQKAATEAKAAQVGPSHASGTLRCSSACTPTQDSLQRHRRRYAGLDVINYACRNAHRR